MPNYATKADLKNATRVDTSNFARKVDLANLNLDINKLKLESTIFYQIFIFSPNDSPLKTEIFFISSEKLFSFTRYSNFCNFFPYFLQFPDSKGQKLNNLCHELACKN